MGFSRFVLAPIPDRRLGFLKASLRTRQCEIRSEWQSEGSEWKWSFVIPEKTFADVVHPNGFTESLGPGRHSRSICSSSMTVLE